MDRRYFISVGTKRSTTFWRNIQVSWSDLLYKLSVPVVTKETYSEYLAMPRDKQSDIKDVGGFVSGYLINGKRSSRTVGSRSMATLDLDFADMALWDRLVNTFCGVSMCLHGTHKHSDTMPRFRLIMPFSRDVTPEEYTAVTRKVAEIVGIELFDRTTFQTERLMYWPSISSGAPYYFRYQTGADLNVDYVLSMYRNWRDVSEYCFHPDEEPYDHHNKAHAQADPLEKEGPVGAFCRAYTIESAIDTFLSDIYRRESDDRYTYINATTSNGLVIYDHKFAYSHHSTDPASGQQCNAFDLVRIHLYGHLDEGHDFTSKKTPPSFRAMHDAVVRDGEVKKENLKKLGTRFELSENIRQDAATVFKDFVMPADINKTVEIFSSQLGRAIHPDVLEKEPPVKYNKNESPEYFTPTFKIEDDVNDWESKLETDKKGVISNAFNLKLIFENDPVLKGILVYNSFEQKRYINGSTPWDGESNIRQMEDSDYAGIRRYLDIRYGIRGKEMIEDAIILSFRKNRYNPVINYLRSLKWDGRKRIDTIFTKVLGVKNTEYSREVARLFFGGAVARAFYPGCKYDCCLTLVGDEGAGKSTFLKNLAGQWFSDSFNTIKGNGAFEQLQNAWIMEVGELKGFKQAEVEVVKQYLSKREDTYRPAYGRSIVTMKRNNVFVATTNEDKFLKGDKNRRFWPLTVHKSKIRMSALSKEFKALVPQLWAEAVHISKSEGFIVDGVVRDLNDEAKELAQIAVSGRTITDERVGLIEAFCNTPIPNDFESQDITTRDAFYADPSLRAPDCKERDYVCTMEIWKDCLGRDLKSFNRMQMSEIRDIMSTLDGWEISDEKKYYKVYGTQQIYRRIKA